VAVVNIPIVHKAVDWWRGLHQGKTVLGTIDPEMGGTQLFAMYSSLIAGVLVAVWLLIHRFRAGFLAERASDLGLDQALEERRLESSLGEGEQS
jgi:heme exporter protein C